MEEKICININCLKVGLFQPLSNFYFRKDTQKYRNECLICYKLKQKGNYILNKENYLKYNKEHREQKIIKELNAKIKHLYYINNREKELARTKIWYDNNRANPNCKTKPEKFIEQFLIQNNIEFKYNYIFKDCLSPKGYTLEFDFWLPELKFAIEFDGIFHFEPIFGIEPLQNLQQNDKIKNSYCENKNIKLIRISYLENLEFKLKENFNIL